MKICFIGIGSIARRHIENLVDLLGHEKIQIDALRSKTINAKEKYIENMYFNYEDMPSDYDIIFITNPTSRHLESLVKVQDKAKAFFIEKPLRIMKENQHIDNSDDMKILSKLRKDAIYYVACPLRYTEIIRYVKEKIDWSDVLSIRCISSSYLPDWRPGQDYRKTYSAQKILGGGVAADLIHEWDYISYLVGQPDTLLKLEKKVSDLEIDSNDIAVYIGECHNIIVEVHLDYFGRSPIRKMELYTNEDTIVCDFLKATIEYVKQNISLNFSEKRNDFQKKELHHFLNICAGNMQNDNRIEDANHLMQILEGTTCKKEKN